MTDLATARLRLRRWRPGDAPLLHQVDADREVVRWAHRGFYEDPPDLEHLETVRLPALLDGYEQDPPREHWAAFEQPEDVFAGFFFLTPGPAGAEIGYRLRRGAWGRGLATEGCRAVLDHGRAVGVTRFVASVVVHNPASARVVEKLGFRCVRASDRHGFEDREYELCA